MSKHHSGSVGPQERILSWDEWYSQEVEGSMKGPMDSVEDLRKNANLLKSLEHLASITVCPSCGRPIDEHQSGEVGCSMDFNQAASIATQQYSQHREIERDC